jgi:hypothetical protein
MYSAGPGPRCTWARAGTYTRTGRGPKPGTSGAPRSWKVPADTAGLIAAHSAPRTDDAPRGFFVHSPGTYAFDIQAPGFQTHRVKETVAAVESQGCCSCGYESKTVTVQLQPQ